MLKRNNANMNGHAPALVITTVIVGETEESFPITGKKQDASHTMTALMLKRLHGTKTKN